MGYHRVSYIAIFSLFSRQRLKPTEDLHVHAFKVRSFLALHRARMRDTLFPLLATLVWHSSDASTATSLL